MIYLFFGGGCVCLLVFCMVFCLGLFCFESFRLMWARRAPQQGNPFLFFCCCSFCLVVDFQDKRSHQTNKESKNNNKNPCFQSLWAPFWAVFQRNDRTEKQNKTTHKHTFPKILLSFFGFPFSPFLYFPLFCFLSFLSSFLSCFLSFPSLASM